MVDRSNMLTFKQFIKEQIDALPPPKPAIIRTVKQDPIGELIKKYVPARKDPIGELIHRHVTMPEQQQEFDDFIKRTIKFEGDKGQVTTDTGGLTKYGISKKANPHLSDDQIKNLTVDDARKIYRKNYYDELGDIGHLSKKSRTIVYDASVNHGPEFAKQMVKQVGDNPAKLIDHRKSHYDFLASANPPKYAKYHKGWINRLEQLKKELEID